MTGPTILLTTHIPGPSLIGPASVSAAVVVAVLAFAVRRTPSPQCEGLSILAPPACFFLALYSNLAVHLPDSQHYVETFIYLAAAFAFSVHNLHFASKYHWVYGSICSLITGTFIVLFCSLLAIQGALRDFPEILLIAISETLFIFFWTCAFCFLLARRRRSNEQ